MHVRLLQTITGTHVACVVIVVLLAILVGRCVLCGYCSSNDWWHLYRRLQRSLRWRGQQQLPINQRPSLVHDTVRPKCPQQTHGWLLCNVDKDDVLVRLCQRFQTADDDNDEDIENACAPLLGFRTPHRGRVMSDDAPGPKCLKQTHDWPLCRVDKDAALARLCQKLEAADDDSDEDVDDLCTPLLSFKTPHRGRVMSDDVRAMSDDALERLRWHSTAPW